MKTSAYERVKSPIPHDTIEYIFFYGCQAVSLKELFDWKIVTSIDIHTEEHRRIVLTLQGNDDGLQCRWKIKRRPLALQALDFARQYKVRVINSL